MTIKKLTPQLAIDSEFFHLAFSNPCTMLNKRRSRSGVRFTTQLAIRYLISNYCIRWLNFKGLSQDGRWADFYKSLCASIFNDDLSNEPDFGSISLDSTVMPLSGINVALFPVWKWARGQLLFIAKEIESASCDTEN
jgi:hypothetical protein